MVLAAVALAVLGAPASAPATSGDIAATQKYIQANYALVQAGVSKLGPARAALRSVQRRIEGECPAAAAASPQNPDSTQLSNELIGAMVTSAYHTDVPAGNRFIRATQGLRWSSRALTSAVQTYAGNLKVLNALATPNVCADVRAWVASKYQTLPASTVRFDQQFMPNWVAIGLVPGGLSAFEQSSQRAILHRTNALEDQLTEFEAGDGVETWWNIMNVLVLNP